MTSSNTRLPCSQISRATTSTITRQWRTTGTRSSDCLTVVSERGRVHSVINVDDPYGVELAASLEKDGLHVIRYAVNSDADVTARDPEFSLSGMRFRLSTPAGERDFHSPLVGPPHIYNTLAAVASGLALGYSLDVVTAALEKCTGAPGRFERVAHDGGFSVVVDYAHSDDALLNVLRTAREVVKGKIITVFGCGGDRDRTKRAPMGEAAGSLSDVVILTSDNPRTEDPEQILCDAEEGIQRTGKPYRKIADRTEAIHQAIAEAQAGDLVLIAGKGHEDYQIIGRETFHFDDKEVARAALSQRGLDRIFPQRRKGAKKYTSSSCVFCVFVLCLMLFICVHSYSILAYGQPTTLATIKDKSISESSGLVASRTIAGRLLDTQRFR